MTASSLCAYIALALLLLLGLSWYPAGSAPYSESSISASFLVPGSELTSPSGRYTISLREETKEDFSYYSISLYSYQQPAPIQLPESTFRARDTLFVLWDDTKDRVWAYSGDIGTYFWDYTDDGTWERYSWQGTGETPPQALKDARPAYFADS